MQPGIRIYIYVCLPGGKKLFRFQNIFDLADTQLTSFSKMVLGAPQFETVFSFAERFFENIKLCGLGSSAAKKIESIGQHFFGGGVVFFYPTFPPGEIKTDVKYNEKKLFVFFCFLFSKRINTSAFGCSTVFIAIVFEESLSLLFGLCVFQRKCVHSIIKFSYFLFLLENRNF